MLKVGDRVRVVKIIQDGPLHRYKEDLIHANNHLEKGDFGTVLEIAQGDYANYPHVQFDSGDAYFMEEELDGNFNISSASLEMEMRTFLEIASRYRQVWFTASQTSACIEFLLPEDARKFSSLFAQIVYLYKTDEK